MVFKLVVFIYGWMFVVRVWRQFKDVKKRKWWIVLIGFKGCMDVGGLCNAGRRGCASFICFFLHGARLNVILVSER